MSLRELFSRHGLTACVSDEGPERLRYAVGEAFFEMVVVPPRSFVMGSPEDEDDRESDEAQHEVTLTRAYAIATTAVTHALYESVTGTNPSAFTKGPDAARRPVEHVSWFDAVRFCNALSERAKLRPAYVIGAGEEPSVEIIPGAEGFRLPTEVEWECAARSGGDAYVYAGSDDVDAVAWHSDAVYDADDVRIHPPTCTAAQPVATRAPTRWGLYDVSGNVWEWCQDWSDRYPTAGVTDPDGPADGFNRVHRGGSWYNDAHSARVASRGRNDPGSREASIGFRLARTIS
jgi:formylglycine-generating enzyme required for sulfatase activity